MVKFGILSDTHIKPDEVIGSSEFYIKTMERLKYLLRDVDQIIHAGDLVCKEFLLELEKIAPVSAVCGNMDVVSNISTLPRKLLLEFEGIKIGVTHQIENFHHFEDDKIRIFIYGHTHVPSITSAEKGCLMINPGSIRHPRKRPKKQLFQQEITPHATLVLLEIEDDIITTLMEKL